MFKQSSVGKTVGGKKQAGALLIESMVALAIFSIAMLSLSAAQLTTSKTSFSSMLKTETAISTSEIIDLMRANLAGVTAGQYNHAINAGLYATPANQAQLDINKWLTNLPDYADGTVFGSGLDAGIACVGFACRITIEWDDTRANQGDASGGVSDLETFRYITDVNL